MAAAREEAEMVLFDSVRNVLEEARLKPGQVTCFDTAINPQSTVSGIYDTSKLLDTSKLGCCSSAGFACAQPFSVLAAAQRCHKPLACLVIMLS